MSTPKPKKFLVTADAWVAAVQTLGRLPYNQVAPVMAKLDRGAVPVYDDPLAEVKRSAPPVEEAPLADPSCDDEKDTPQ